MGNMRYVNSIILSGPDTSSQNGPQIDADALFSVSLQAVFGDTSAIGAIKLQVSNDICKDGHTPNSFVVTNWSDLTGASVSVTAGGVVLLPKTDICYRWLRAVYTSSSAGSSSVNITMYAQSI